MFTGNIFISLGVQANTPWVNESNQHEILLSTPWKEIRIVLLISAIRDTIKSPLSELTRVRARSGYLKSGRPHDKKKKEMTLW